MKMLRKIMMSAALVLGAMMAHAQLPVISAKTTTPCTGATFTVQPTNGGGDVVPAGTTYSWGTPATPAGLSITVGGTGTAATSIQGNITNSTNDQLSVSFTVTPTSLSGTGNPFTVTVNVNPYAQASDIAISTPAPICGGLNATLTTTLAGSSTIQNPIFLWYTNAILGSQVGTGTSFTTNILNNNTTFYVQVSGTNACPNQSGNGQPVTVTVSGVAPNVSITGGGAQNVCAGLATTTTAFTSTSQGTIYNWTFSNTAIGAGLTSTGTGNIGSFVTANSTLATISATIIVTPFTNTNSCSGTPLTFSISVLPVPVATDASINICSGNATSFTAASVPAGTRYTWVPNYGNSSITAGGNAQGTGQLSFNPTFQSNVITSTDISFTVTPSFTAGTTCAGTPFQLTVTVKPTPSITNQVTTTCSSVAFEISPTNVPVGTVYTWGVPILVTGSITGSGSQASQQPMVSQTLANTLATTAQIRYNITPNAGGCIGASFSGTVQVYPRPTLTNVTTATICNNVPFTFTPASGTSPITYSWSRAAVTGIANPLTGSTGVAGLINETLNNTGTVNQQVTYAFTLSANGCSNAQNVFVTVKPTLNLSSELTKNTCTNAVFTYVATSATTPTTLSWTRTAVPDISNPPATGGTSVNETLINTSFSPVTVIYEYRNTSGACSDVTNVSVTVNPLPSVNTVAAQLVCSGDNGAVTLTGSSVNNTVYNWTNTNANIGLTNSGDGNIAFLAYNATYAPIAATISVTPAANGCNGAIMNFGITVNPAPTLSSSLTMPAVCSGQVVAYSPTGYVNNTTYAWSRPTQIGIDNAAGSGTGSVNETLINSSNVPLQVPYNYVLTANGCSNTQLVNVTINPVPAMFNPGNQLACNNSTKVVNFSGSIVSGTAYFWTNDNPSIGIASVGTGDIFFVANTTSPDSVYANIKVAPQAYGCVGPEQAFKIIVNPPLSLTSSLSPPAVCSNSLFGYTPSSTAANPLYIWNRAGVNGISNSPASGSGSIQEILVNTTSAPLNVTYDFTLSSNGCVKNETVVVPVSPALVLSNANISNEVCSGSPFIFSPVGNITGVDYLWSRAAVTGISNAAANGTGDVNETLVNTTDAPIEVTYRFSLGTGASCAADQVIHVTVKPIPRLTGNKTIDACSNAPVAYTPVGNIAGTNFNWSRAVVAGISNTPAVGLVGISESLINTTTGTVNATYIYSLTNYNGCSNTENVIVQLKPAPVAGTSTDQSICADDVTRQITFTSNLSGTTFNWTNSEPSIGLAASGTGSAIPAFKSINTSSGQLVAIIQVNPVANGCTGNTVTVERITVNRAITTSFIEIQPLIACEGQPVGPFVASVPLGGDGSTYQFQWQVSTDSLNFVDIPGATSRQLIAPAITKDSYFRMNTVSLGCSARTSWQRVVLKGKPIITIDNRDSKVISIGNSTQLVTTVMAPNGIDLLPTGSVTYLWTPADSTIDDFRSANPYVKPRKATTYTVVATTLDGCSVSQSITIEVNPEGFLIYPNTLLTPNNDGYNDTWEIKNIIFYPNNTVKIYNANGIIVWQAEKYTGGWTGVGTSGGKLSSGTYYYSIAITPTGTSTVTAVTAKGYLTILN